MADKEAAIEFIWITSDDEARNYLAALILKQGDTSPTFVKLFERNTEDGINLKATRHLYKLGGRNGLDTMIWQKFAPHLENTYKIYYALEGPTSLLNFGAIPINETETVADRYQLHQYGNLRDFVLAEKETKVDYAQNATLFGGIAYGEAYGEKNLPPSI